MATPTIVNTSSITSVVGPAATRTAPTIHSIPRHICYNWHAASPIMHAAVNMVTRLAKSHEAAFIAILGVYSPAQRYDNDCNKTLLIIRRSEQ